MAHGIITMSTALPTELQPVVVIDRMSRIKVINNTLQNFWGLGADGPNERPVPIRRGSEDIYNETREVATAILPGSVSSTIAPHPVGSFNYSIPLSHESMPLDAERLFNIREIGKGANVIDVYGMNYIADQEREMKRRMVNMREFQVAAMMRGSYTYTQSGQMFTHSFSGGTYTVDYQIPSTNKTTINSIIDATWATTTTHIPAHLFAINAYSIELSGRGIRHGFINSAMWANLLKNTDLQNQAGSVNQIFDYIDRNEQDETFTARLKAIPWITWHINDNGLKLSGTFTKLFADTQCVLTVQPDAEIAQYLMCPTPVVKNYGAPVTGIVGEDYWYLATPDPAGYQLHTCLSGLPFLRIPKGIFNATPVF